MVSLVKNQIVKALSGFTKNLTPDQISLQVLMGKAGLENVDVNEDVLAEKLELPSFLRVDRATCRRVIVKIPWRDLSNKSIELHVDEISVFLRITADDIGDGGDFLSPMMTKNSKNNKTAMNSRTGHHTPKPYGLGEKMVECLRLNIDNVYVQFESASFGGSINLTNLVVDNRTPSWEPASSSKESRFHNKTLKQVLFFKQVSWQLLRIEASKNSSETHLSGGRRNTLNSPLRFISLDGGFARISIKKSSRDCSLLAGRLDVNLKEIIWTATMVHFQSAIELYKHILAMAQAARMREYQAQPNPFLMVTPTSDKGGRTSPFQPSASPGTALPNGLMAMSSDPMTQALLNFSQTSHHVTVNTIEIHLTDDSRADALPADWGLESADMGIVLHQFTLDFYPSSCVGGGPSINARQSWFRYRPQPNAFTELQDRQLEHHYDAIGARMEANPRERFCRAWPQLCARHVVLRLGDAKILCVSDMSTKRDELRAFIQHNSRRRSTLPKSPILHMEVASYFFPGTTAFPVPPDSMHMQVSSLDILAELKTIRWLIYAAESIVHAFESNDPSSGPVSGSSNTADAIPEIRIDVIMPRVQLKPSILASDPQPQDPRLPVNFFLNFSTISATNFVLAGDTTLPQPVLFQGILSDAVMEFVSRVQSCSKDPKVADVYSLLCRRARIFTEEKSHLPPATAEELLLPLGCSEFFVYVPAVWLSCEYASASSTAEPFEQALISDATVFASLQDCPRDNSLAIVVEPRGPISACLDHFQYVQLIRIVDDVTALLDRIEADRRFLAQQRASANENEKSEILKSASLGIFCHLDKLRVQLLLPTSTFSPYQVSASDSNNGQRKEQQQLSSTSVSSQQAFDEGSAPSTRPSSSNLQQSATPAGFVSDPLKGERFSNICEPSSFENPVEVEEPISVVPVATNDPLSGNIKTFVASSITATTTSSVISTSGSMSDFLHSKFASGSETSSPRRYNIPRTASGLTYNYSQSDLDSQGFMDDTASVCTTLSGDESNAAALSLLNKWTLVGGIDEAETAEEVFESPSIEERRVLAQQQTTLFEQTVNVFDLTLSDFNVYVNAPADSDVTTTHGYASEVLVRDRLSCRYGNVVNGAAGCSASDYSVAENMSSICDGEPAKKREPEPVLGLTVRSQTQPKEASINVDLVGLVTALDDDVISHLGPFLDDDRLVNDQPPSLTVNIRDSDIQIRNPRKMYPMTLRLRDLVITDGPQQSSSKRKENREDK